MLDKTQVEMLRKARNKFAKKERAGMSQYERQCTVGALQGGWDAAIKAVLELAATAAPAEPTLENAIQWLEGAVIDDEGRLILSRDYIISNLRRYKPYFKPVATPSQPAAAAKEVECPSCEGWLLDQRPQVDGMCEACNGTGKIAQPAAPERPTTDDEFKNFHRNLCEQFDYLHDENDWKRDQVSLIEHITKKTKLAQPVAPADQHKQGCQALGGYGHGAGPCDCGAQPVAQVETKPLTAPFPGMDEPWSDGEISKFDAALSRYEEPAQPVAPAEQLGDLSTLVRRLVQALRKASPGNDLADKAMDYLKRKGLTGNPLRDIAQPAVPEPQWIAALRSYLPECHPDERISMTRQQLSELLFAAPSQQRLQYVLENYPPMMSYGAFRCFGVTPIVWHKTAIEAIDAAIAALAKEQP